MKHIENQKNNNTIPINNTNQSVEIADNLSRFPKIPNDINILLPISWGEKKNYISSCWFWVLANWVKTLNLTLSEKEIKELFLQQTPTAVLRELTKLRRNLVWTGPSIIKSRFKKLLHEQWKKYTVIEKSWINIDEIIKLLQEWQALMVMYTRQQKLLFETMKEKSELFDKYLWKYERTFTYPYPHYALLVGLNSNNQTVAILDPNTWVVENIPFQLWREQFCLEKKHQWSLFHFAKKIWLMKPRTAIYLEEIS